MRLSEQDIRHILEAAEEVFGPEAEVRLFGSRVDDSKRGGDIDLHVTIPPRPDWYAQQIAFGVALFHRLGDRKSDIVVLQRGDEPRAIDRVALATGVPLG